MSMREEKTVTEMCVKFVRIGLILFLFSNGVLSVPVILAWCEKFYIPDKGTVMPLQ